MVAAVRERVTGLVALGSKDVCRGSEVAARSRGIAASKMTMTMRDICAVLRLWYQGGAPTTQACPSVQAEAQRLPCPSSPSRQSGVSLSRVGLSRLLHLERGGAHQSRVPSIVAVSPSSLPYHKSRHPLRHQLLNQVEQHHSSQYGPRTLLSFCPLLLSAMLSLCRRLLHLVRRSNNVSFAASTVLDIIAEDESCLTITAQNEVDWLACRRQGEACAPWHPQRGALTHCSASHTRATQIESLRAQFGSLIVCPGFAGVFGRKADDWGRVFVPGAADSYSEAKKIWTRWARESENEKYSWWPQMMREKGIQPITVSLSSCMRAPGPTLTSFAARSAKTSSMASPSRRGRPIAGPMLAVAMREGTAIVARAFATRLSIEPNRRRPSMPRRACYVLAQAQPEGLHEGREADELIPSPRPALARLHKAPLPCFVHV